LIRSSSRPGHDHDGQTDRSAESTVSSGSVCRSGCPLIQPLSIARFVALLSLWGHPGAPIGRPLIDPELTFRSQSSTTLRHKRRVHEEVHLNLAYCGSRARTDLFLSKCPSAPEAGNEREDLFEVRCRDSTFVPLINTLPDQQALLRNSGSVACWCRVNTRLVNDGSAMASAA